MSDMSGMDMSGMDMSSMDMSGMGEMSMGNMYMGPGVPTPYGIEKSYWYVLGGVLGFATLVNLWNKLVYLQRIQAARRGQQTAAKPKNFLFSAAATITAVGREITYATFSPRLLRRLGIQIPTLGGFLLVTGLFLLTIIHCFYMMDPTDVWQYEMIAYRIGYLACAQLPLIFILSGKNNIIGLLSGMSYEKLNWIHRWAARIMFLTQTIHFILWLEDWARYDYIAVKFQTDKITQRGLAAWVIQLWMVIFSSKPFRNFSYEFFVVQHIITIGGFSAAVYLHLPPDVKYVVLLSVAFAIFDRVVRAINVFYNNVNFFPGRNGRKVVGYQAQLQRLPGDVTRMTIKNPGFSWTPGQHVFLACHGILPLQAHPFTIVSLPQDRQLTFLVKARKGATKKFLSKAGDELPLLERDYANAATFATVEGPYGRMRPLRQFDSVVFLAGGSGSTFTVPLMRALVQRPPGLVDRLLPGPFDAYVTKHVRFVWVVKSRAHLAWFADDIANALCLVAQQRRQGRDFELSVAVYVTCDESLDREAERDGRVEPEVVEVGEKAAGAKVAAKRVHACGLDGSCCCKRVVDEEEKGEIQNAEEHVCMCDNGGDDAADSASLASEKAYSSASSGLDIHPAIAVFGGRPHVRNIIRRTLEQARGESAVVACGPQGMITDVRTSVVSLSDERAVHKGTGAQGIYLHTEAFSY